MENNIISVKIGLDPPKRKCLNKVSCLTLWSDTYHQLLFPLEILEKYSPWLIFSFDNENGARKLQKALPVLAHEEQITKNQEIWSWRYQTQLHKLADKWVLWVRKLKVEK